MEHIRPIPLHKGKCLADLREEHEVNFSTMPFKRLCESLTKLVEQAEVSRLEGDEEQSYILYKKFVGLIQWIITNKEDARCNRLLKTVDWKAAVSACNHSETLEVSLKKRYEVLNKGQPFLNLPSSDDRGAAAKQEEIHLGWFPRKTTENVPQNYSGAGGVSEGVGEEAASVSPDWNDVNLEQRMADTMIEGMKKDMEVKMEEAFTCSICFELFIKAVTLNCSHTFCQFCIREWQVNERRLCPTCRTPITSETRISNIDNYLEDAITSLSIKIQDRRQEALERRRNNLM